MKAYDEEAIIADYVWRHYAQYFTKAERRAGIVVWAERKQTAGAQRLVERVWRSERLDQDASVTNLLAEGAEAFHRRAAVRVLETHGPEIFINRCPRCSRVVCTPKTQQCLWCGYDWHTRPYPAAAEG